MENNNIQINDFGEAFQNGRDPLLVVSLGEMIVTGVEYSNIVSVQLGTNCSREEILCLLLARTDSSIDQTVTVPEVMSCAGFSSHWGDQPKISAVTRVSDQNVQMNWSVFQEMSDVLKFSCNHDSGTSANVSTVNCKEKVNANVNFLTAAIHLCSEKNLYVAEDLMEEARNMLQELKQLFSLMNTSTVGKGSIEQLLKFLLSRKPKLEVFLNHFIVPKGITVGLENQCAVNLDVACDEVAMKDLLPSASTSETRGGNQAEGRRGKGSGNIRKEKEIGRSKQTCQTI